MTPKTSTRPAIRLRSVEIREIRLPLREPFTISSGTVSDRRILLLRLTHADGPSVWSECVAGERPNYTAETVDTAWLALREWLVPRALDRDFDGPKAVAPALAEGVRGHRMARAAVEMGCWALWATLRGVPLFAALGGERDRVETGISLGIQGTPEELVEKAREATAAGYRKVKLKIRPGADLEFVAAVREALGPDAALAVDANAAYGPEDEDHLARLDDHDLLMLEQPFEGGDLLRHARLQARIRTPVCLDESITSPERAMDMLELDAGRVVNIKPGRVGGFSSSIRIHDLCLGTDVPVWCGGMLESGVGRAYNVALASLPGFTLPGDLSPSARYWHRDIVTPEWTMREGRVAVPRDAPGLGVEVDEDRVDDLTARVERLG